MSLQRQLILVISLLIMLLLSANLILTTYNARLNVFGQLQVHAEDTATSLGFTISRAALDNDAVQISSMIDVIFDRGYYRRIVYRNLQGQDVLKRELPINVEHVPQWFIDWLTLPEPSGRASVESGWYQLGEIEVVSHPGFAYRDLWRTFKEQVWLFLMTAVLCYGLSGIAVKYLLKPLRQVEAQADAICRKEFYTQDTLPRIPELRRVIVAMNRMVSKVQAMFQQQLALSDQLHEQTRRDEVTGLANRKDFDTRLSAYLNSEKAGGSMMIALLRVGDLEMINREHGRGAGDDYLKAVAAVISSVLNEHPASLLSRHSGADFALFVPVLAEDESQHLASQLYAQLQALEWQQGPLQAVYIGACYIAHADPSQALLAAADRALSQAQNEHSSGCHWQVFNDSQPTFAASQWSQMLNQAITQKAVQFYYQPVWKTLNNQRFLLFDEVMCRLVIDGKEYPAGAFMPMATRLHLMTAIDFLVIESLLEHPDSLPQRVCINLSMSAIQDSDFIDYLHEQLSALPAIGPRLVFELPANGLSIDEVAVRSFANTIKALGASLSLHHFGQGTAEFAYLQSLPVDYLKIDRCFIQHIATDGDHRFFIRTLVAIAKTCDITILAEGIEDDEQWQVLLSLGVEGGQGFWLGKPQSQPTIS